MNILFAPRVLGVCAVVTMLAGCNSAAMAPTRGSGLAPNGTSAISAVANRVADLHRANSEKLRSRSGSGGDPTNCYDFVTVNGKASGPYHGTFTGGGSYGNGICHRDNYFFGNFVITSGTNTITGAFSGAGQGRCGRGGCGDGGKMMYTATLEPGSKTLSGNGNAEMHNFGSIGSMYVTLRSL